MANRIKNFLQLAFIISNDRKSSKIRRASIEVRCPLNGLNKCTVYIHRLKRTRKVLYRYDDGTPVKTR